MFRCSAAVAAVVVVIRLVTLPCAADKLAQASPLALVACTPHLDVAHAITLAAARCRCRIAVATVLAYEQAIHGEPQALS